MSLQAYWLPVDMTQSAMEVRVTVLEQEVEGEKIVTRHILEQTRHNSDDLAALKSRTDRIERKVDGLRDDFNNLRNDFNSLRNDFNSLRQTLPRQIADVMREVLREVGKLP